MAYDTPMRESTIVTPRGWWDLADAAAFYPTDLPEDWRLGYFANQFGASLLPWNSWQNAAPTLRAQWLGDVAPGFRFIAEAGPGSAERETQATLQQALGASLYAWLAHSGGFEPQAPDLQARRNADGSSDRLACWRVDAGSGRESGTTHERQPGSTGDGRAHRAPDSYGVIARQTLHQDLRAARSWLEGLSIVNGRPPTVVILASPSSKTLETWLQLIELLGLESD